MFTPSSQRLGDMTSQSREDAAGVIGPAKRLACLRRSIFSFSALEILGKEGESGATVAGGPHHTPPQRQARLVKVGDF
jgi:hypothetical protein